MGQSQHRTAGHWISLEEAAGLVQDGHTLALGGMTLYRRPMSFVRALLRRAPRPHNLTLFCFTAGIESDLLVGAGVVRAVRSCYFGLETFGFAPMFTDAVHRSALQVIEETETSLALGIRAAIAGVGFMPSRAWIGTDLPRLRPDVKTIRDPYSGEELTAFPAIPCDVAVIHALEADRQGNAKINANSGVDVDLVHLADTVVITAERIVDRVDPGPETLLIPYPGASYLAHAPKGAWPTSCYPHYALSGEAFLRYIDFCNAGQFSDFLTEFLNTPSG